MTRIIRVESCTQCPNLDHRGAFGEVAYVPRCRITDETLPHTLGRMPRGKPIASPTGEIPESCPLIKLEEAKP